MAPSYKRYLTSKPFFSWHSGIAAVDGNMVVDNDGESIQKGVLYTVAGLSSEIVVSTGVGNFCLLAGGSQEAERQLDQLVRLYHSDLESNPGFDHVRFRRKFFDEYLTKPNFRLTSLWDNEDLVGFVCGNSLVRQTCWWRGVLEPLPAAFTEKNGNRTAALKDIVVARKLRGNGLGGLLHAKFLEERFEQRVTLLSSPLDQPAGSS